MREPDFTGLAERLLAEGIAPRCAHRTVNELRDHYDDLVDAAVDGGAGSREAREIALQRLGSMDEFIAAMSAQRDLKTWAFRYPRAAVFVYPLACLVALPALPVFAGVAYRDVIAKWGASLLVAGLFTATLLLVLQLSILFA